MIGVIVFVKNPELGKVKTRLAATVGDEKALDIYNRLVAYTREVLLGSDAVDAIVYYSSFIDRKDEWSNVRFEKRLQVQGGLGDKITAAVQESFNDYEKIIIIGSDCPQLTKVHIQDAIAYLNTNNVVIGPSKDGGYYLLGMDHYYPSLFQDIPWSTETVAMDTLQQAEALGLRTHQLEILSDIDYEEDWINYGFD